MIAARTLGFALVGVLVPMFAGTALAQGNEAATANPTTFSDWVLETSSEGANKFCYIATTAQQLAAGPAKRSASVLYISAWPKDGIKSEISIKLGFVAKAAAGAKVSIGKEVFKLFINNEHAFVSDATQELKLVEAMKKGAKLTVEATAQGGGQVIDTYSLSGIGQALQAQAAACP